MKEELIMKKREGVTTLRLEFRIGIDVKGNLTYVTRTCNVLRPRCNGCTFKKWCDEIEKRIVTPKNVGGAK